MIRPSAAMQAAYHLVAEAIDALDDSQAALQMARFIAALEPAPDEVIRGAGASLAGLWFEADRIWPDDSPGVTVHRRELISNAVDALDRYFPRLALRAALDPASLAAQDAERLRLKHVLLNSPEQAVRPALAVVERFGETMTDALGEMVVRCLLIEGARLERLAETPPAELPAALRLALEHQAWLPDDLTRADLAVAIATMDCVRDDRTRLEETLDLAEGGPFAVPSSAGYLAVLRAAAALGRFDVVEGERLLRLAAEPVTASADPSLVTLYRSLCDMVARTRRQRISDPFVEMAPLKPDATHRAEVDDMTLILDAGDQIARGGIDDRLRDRLAAWRATGHATSAVENRALLWGLSALLAVADGQSVAAHDFAAHCREARALMPSGGMRTAYIDQLLTTFGAANAMRDSDPSQAADSLTSGLGESGRDENSVLTRIAESQQAILYLAAKQYREALRCGIRALTALRRATSGLPGSSERAATMDTHEPLLDAILKSAAAIGEDQLMAEVIEFLCAQELPIADRAPDVSRLPLAQAVPPASGQRVFLRSAKPLTDVVEAREPAPVLMPWGTVALSSILGDSSGRPARVVVPR